MDAVDDADLSVLRNAATVIGQNETPEMNDHQQRAADVGALLLAQQTQSPPAREPGDTPALTQ